MQIPSSFPSKSRKAKGTIEGASYLGVCAADAVDPLHDQHLLAAELPVHAGDLDGGVVLKIIVEVLDVARLHGVVQLLQKPRGATGIRPCSLQARRFGFVSGREYKCMLTGTSGGGELGLEDIHEERCLRLQRLAQWCLHICLVHFYVNLIRMQ